MIETNYDLSKVIGIILRKAFEFKEINSFSKDEFELFWNSIKKDEEFINAYINCIRNKDNNN